MLLEQFIDACIVAFGVELDESESGIKIMIGVGAAIARLLALPQRDSKIYIKPCLVLCCGELGRLLQLERRIVLRLIDSTVADVRMAVGDLDPAMGVRMHEGCIKQRIEMREDV